MLLKNVQISTVKLHITLNFLPLQFFMMSRVAQSVWCLATDSTTGRSKFDPRQRRNDFSYNLCVQTGSGAHSVSCTMGTGGPFPWGKARPGRDPDHSLSSSTEVVNE
jgi:hypothetical protein